MENTKIAATSIGRVIGFLIGKKEAMSISFIKTSVQVTETTIKRILEDLIDKKKVEVIDTNSGPLYRWKS